MGITMERDVISAAPCSVREGRDFRHKLEIKSGKILGTGGSEVE